MALTQDQLVYIRRKVGTSPDDATLNSIFARTNDVDELVLEVLETRLADMKAQPTSFSVPGYSQSTGNNIPALEQEVAALGGGAGAVRIVEPPEQRPR